MSTSLNSQMHKDIIAASSKKRLPMLARGSYAQWKSLFMRYVDTKPNRELLKKTIYEGPYIMTEIAHQETPEDGDRPRVHPEKETYANTGPENRKLIDAEAEAVHMILNGIGNDIYSTVDACPNAKEIWIEIERLQQGESINIQDVRNKLKVDNMQIMSHIPHSDILKQHQNEVNEIHAERISSNYNALTLVSPTQNYPNDYYQAPPALKPYKSHTPSSRQTTSTRSNATTKKKGKEIIKQPSHQSESASEEDSDEEQA
ncbi:hypothetical protein Tco_1307149 [Tanacetum coccineum]